MAFETFEEYVKRRKAEAARGAASAGQSTAGKKTGFRTFEQYRADRQAEEQRLALEGSFAVSERAGAELDSFIRRANEQYKYGYGDKAAVATTRQQALQWQRDITRQRSNFEKNRSSYSAEEQRKISERLNRYEQQIGLLASAPVAGTEQVTVQRGSQKSNNVSFFDDAQVVESVQKEAQERADTYRRYRTAYDSGRDAETVKAEYQKTYERIQSLDRQISDANRWEQDRAGLAMVADLTNQKTAAEEQIRALSEELGYAQYFYQLDSFTSLPQREDYAAKAAEGERLYAAYQSQADDLETMERQLWDAKIMMNHTSDPTELERLRAEEKRLEQQITAYSGYAENISMLTDEEKKNYYYLLATDLEKAGEYYDVIRSDLRQERLQELSDWAGKNIGTQLLASLGSTAALGVAWLDPLMAAENKYEIGPGQWRDTLRSGVAQKYNEQFGTIDESVPVLGGQGLGNLYQLGMSMTDSAVAKATMGKYGTIALAGAAMSSAFNEALANGASWEQAFLQGLVQGVAEGLFECFSIDKLMKQDVSQSMLKNALKQAGVEASEEAMTSISNEIMDRLIMQDKSTYEQAVQQYVAQGMSLEQAREKAGRDFANRLAQDALGGFLSGAGMTAGNYGVQKIRTTAEVKKGSKGAASALMNMKDSNPELYQAVAEAAGVTSQDDTDAAKKKIREYARTVLSEGQTGDTTAAEKITKVVAASMEKARQNASQRFTRDRSGDAWDVVPGLEGARNVRYLEALEMSDEELQAEIEAVRKVRDDETQSDQRREIMQYWLDGYQKAWDEKHGASPQKQTATKRATEFKLEETAETVGNLTAAHNLAVSDISDMLNAGEISAKGISELSENRAGVGEVTVAMPTNAPQSGKESLQNAIAVVPDSLEQGLLYRMRAAGMQVVEYEAGNAQARLDALNALDEVKETQERARETENEIRRRAKEIADSNVALAEAQGSGLIENEQTKNLSEEQRQTFDILAKAAGVSVVMENAAEGNVNGWYQDGVIHIPSNTQNPFQVVLQHELTHRLMETAPGAYMEYRDFALEAVAKREKATVAELVIAQQEKYRRNGIALSNSEAMDEIAADFAGNMVLDVSQYRYLAKAQRSTAGKLLDALKRFLGRAKRWIKAKLEGKEKRERFAERNFGTDYKTAQQAVKLWEKALQETAEHEKTADGADVKPKFSFAEQRVPTYEELTAKPDMDVVDIRTRDTRDYKTQRREFMQSEEMREICRTPVKNMDTGELVFITPATFTHSFSNSGIEQLYAATKIRELVENAVLTHAEEDRNPRAATTGVYTLFAAAQGDAGVQPVKIKIKEQIVDGRGLPKNVDAYFATRGSASEYSAVYDNKVLVVESIEKEDASSSALTADELTSAGKYPSASSKISIADLLSLVKGDAAKYLPGKARYSIEEVEKQEGKAKRQKREDPDMIPKGEKPAREVKVPKKTEHGWTSYTARTAMEASVTPDGAVPELQRVVREGGFSFQRMSNDAATKRAKETVQKKGFQYALYDWAKDNERPLSQNDVALGWFLYDVAITAGDTKTAVDIVTDLSQRVREAARAVQAVRILKKLSPEYQLYSIERTIQRLQEELDERYGAATEQTAEENAQEIEEESTNAAIEQAAEDYARSRESGGTRVAEAPAAENVEAGERTRRRKAAKRQDGRPETEQTAEESTNAAIEQAAEDYAGSRGSGGTQDAAAAAAEDAKAGEQAQQQEAAQRQDEQPETGRTEETQRETAAAQAGKQTESGKPRKRKKRRKRRKRRRKGAPRITVSKGLKHDLLTSQNEAQREAAQKAIYREVAQQLPKRWTDQWNAWRYFAMLFNPRTHVRNILGNLIFMPVRTVKNLTAVGLEATGQFAAEKVFGRQMGRSKTLLNIGSKADRELLAAAGKDYLEVEELIQSGGKYNDTAMDAIRKEQPVFGFKPLEGVRKFNENLLDKEDTWFSKPAYKSALAGYLKVNGISAEEFSSGKMDAQMLDRAREYAIKEAQRATYRDVNAFSEFVSKIGRRKTKSKAATIVDRTVGAVIEGVLPFKKTPANILVRGVMEYSPIGLLRGIKQLAVDVPRGTRTAAEGIDMLASGLTGTALTALGSLLGALGVISGKEDDEEKAAFKELQGQQEYALNIGGKSYTIDWMAPAALPVFVGVELAEVWRDNDGTVDVKEALEAVGNISEPMLELSMLSSLNDLLDDVSFSDNKLMTILSTATTNYITQAVPSIFGSIERITETKRYSTYADKDHAILMEDWQYLIANLGNKFFGEYKQIPFIDAWGREEDTGNLVFRMFSNLVSPGYYSEEQSTPVDAELERLYDAGYEGVFPDRVKHSVKINEAYLSAEEYVTYAKVKGETSLKTVQDVIESDWYAALSDGKKAEAIQYAYEYATYIGKQAAVGYDKDSWVKDAIAAQQEGISIEAYITAKAAAKDVEGLKDSNGNTITNSKGLLIMQEVYNLEDVSESQKEEMIKALAFSGAIGKSIKDYSRSEVNTLISTGGYEYGHEELEEAAEMGISMELYIEFKNKIDGIKGDPDPDEPGKTILGSKKEKILDIINGMDITDEEKDALYRIQKYAESGLYDTPWH